MSGKVGCEGNDSAARISPGRTNLSIETVMIVERRMMLFVKGCLEYFSLVGGATLPFDASVEFLEKHDFEKKFLRTRQ